MTGRVCICVPARNESDRLPVLLNALARQDAEPPLQVALLLNNTEDESAAFANIFARSHDGRLKLVVVEKTFSEPLAHAGSARRAAMDLGAELLDGDEGVLISTDADCRPPRTWVRANLAAMAIDRVVGGRIVLDEREAVDPRLRAVRARLDRYWAQVRAIEDAIDPCPWDQPPRHGDHTGASLAMTVGLYRRAGGVPVMASGEDRALVEHARAVGGRLVHPRSVWTRASARLHGRAQGGMASDLHRISTNMAREAQLLVPDFAHWRRRAEWRRDTRALHTVGELLRRERALTPMPCDMPLKVRR